MFAFQWPYMILLLPLPLLVYLFSPHAKQSAAGEDAPEVAFPRLARLEAAFPHAAPRRKSGRLYYTALALVWIALTAALMRPQIVSRFMPANGQGYDLMLAVDLSGSMNAMDYKIDGERVSRLDMVKSVVSRFIRARRGDRIGLILFGTHAYLHVPLTFDTASVEKMLDNAAVGEAGGATAIGDAVGLAVKALRHKPANARVLILLTDGADNSSTIPPLEAAKLAKSYGIRIYTIGIGTDGLVPFPTKQGMVMTQFQTDPALLEKVAAVTGGRFFEATDSSALRKIYADIDKLEKTRLKERSYMIRSPLYRYPLSVALLLLLGIALAPVYRRALHGV